ncbi:hypothetical protein E2C01_018606 [Portunus trituberculatus]|uniref:Uncharacterized protein n=1 Tax=Portunus trituberculatus TaxID=210409 RepID=A0A5B7DWN2_PORTR|nr:hypothetical protein [Portunus trituberculatus]
MELCGDMEIKADQSYIGLLANTQGRHDRVAAAGRYVTHNSVTCVSDQVVSACFVRISMLLIFCHCNVNQGMDTADSWRSLLLQTCSCMGIRDVRHTGVGAH